MRCGLTGLPTHRELDPAQASSHPLALFIDIDGFIWLNDHYGFLAGDQAIVGVAEAIKLTVSGFSDATVSRVGGEEFLVLLPGMDFVEVNRLARSIVSSVKALAIEYPRRDDSDATMLNVNAVIFRAAPEMITVGPTDNKLPIWKWMSALVYEAKCNSGQKAGVVVDAHEAVWRPQ